MAFVISSMLRAVTLRGFASLAKFPNRNRGPRVDRLRWPRNIEPSEIVVFCAQFRNEFFPECAHEHLVHKLGASRRARHHRRVELAREPANAEGEQAIEQDRRETGLLLQLSASGFRRVFAVLDVTARLIPALPVGAFEEQDAAGRLSEEEGASGADGHARALYFSASCASRSATSARRAGWAAG